ncbi:MAG: hypothetical protein HDR24_00460 [Lachnospiraceae bacterium]|nr:hypothetical protein [Lachnospiraceae bacterium]
MDRIKLFSGTVSTDTTEKINGPYGIPSSTVAIHRGKTDILNKALAEFLDECGADAKYDGNYLWINGVPILFYSYQTTYYVCYFPFNSTAIIAGTATTTDIFDGNDYNFKVRLLGEPTRSFYLVISRNYKTPSFNQVFSFFKATNFINGRDSRIYKYGTVKGGNAFAIDLNDDGVPMDIGRSAAATGFTWKLNTCSDDYKYNPNKYPLVEWNPAIFKVEGCYYGLSNSPLPTASSATADGQTFIRLGDDTFYICYDEVLIKCIS